MKFKVGDTVKVINTEFSGIGNDKIGRKGEITRVDKYDENDTLPCEILTEGFLYWMNESELELI